MFQYQLYEGCDVIHVLPFRATAEFSINRPSHFLNMRINDMVAFLLPYKTFYRVFVLLFFAHYFLLSIRCCQLSAVNYCSDFRRERNNYAWVVFCSDF